ncbi:MAG: hypothetical protein Kow0070_24450 [Anaerolineales bacterium]
MTDASVFILHLLYGQTPSQISYGIIPVMAEFAFDLQTVIARLDALETELQRLRQALRAVALDHLYVESVPDVLGGEPVVKGTRTPVRAIVERWKIGESVEEIARSLPHLRLAQIFDALSYYDDHRDEIEKYIALNRVPAHD